jgi:hypothetical protein
MVVRHRRILSTIDGMFVVGLALGVIGLGTIASGLAELIESTPRSGSPPEIRPLRSGRNATSIGTVPFCTCGIATHDSHHGRSAKPGPGGRLAVTEEISVGGALDEGGDRGEHDTRAYLLNAAFAARRTPWVAHDTRSDLIVNSPAWIGSTSPP